MTVDLPDDEPYVLLPERLALDLRESDLAVGVYLLIARLYLVHQAAIPLSAADIDAFDGSGALRRGAIIRALDRLDAGGWLIEHRRRGQKTTYLPAWGLVGGIARPWDIAEPGLGRPRTLRAMRVPRVVLDVCLGRLTPHHRHAALITRYVTRPPLSLRDIGLYGLGWAGVPAEAPALTRLGLAGPTGPLPPPTWSSLLARISQSPLFDSDAPGLSQQGLQRAGLLRPAAPAMPEAPPLFFVPQDMIGDMIPVLTPPLIGAPIGSAPSSEEASEASPCDKAPLADPALCSAGNQGIQTNVENQGTTTTTHLPSPPRVMGGGGKNEQGSRAPRGRHVPEAAPVPPAPPAPPVISADVNAASSPMSAPVALASENTFSEGERLLRSVGVRADTARQLAHHAPAQIARIIAQARGREGVRDVAGWVVSALRALPLDDLDQSAPPPKVSDLAILLHTGLSNSERMRWLTRFRAADLVERPAVLARFHTEHPGGSSPRPLGEAAYCG
jgi:hypothetical protein